MSITDMRPDADDANEPATVADYTRTPPNDIQAEQSVLGSMMLSERAIEDIALWVRGPGDFYRPGHQFVYNAIQDLYGRNQPVDAVTVAHALTERGEIANAGGAPYLHTLISQVPTVANADHYARIVRDHADRRALIEVLTRSLQRAYTPGIKPTEATDLAMTDLTRLAIRDGNERSEKISVADRLEDFYAELEAGEDTTSLDSPWPDVNEVVEFKPGQLVVVGAATSNGKSLLGLNLGAHVALHRQRPVLFASMEMGGGELMARLIAAEAGVSLDRLVRRQTTEDDLKRISRVNDSLMNARHFILEDSPGMTLSKIRARMRWMTARGHAPGMLVVDYLQLLTPERGGDANRTQEVAAMSRGLKLLAVEFEIPVVALAQFNRGAVGRRPIVSDFKESSGIEQDANIVILLHRPLNEEGTDEGPRAGEVDLIVAKNRNGPSGRTVPLAFQGHLGRLASLAT